jgi:hypothetical protein
MMHPSPSSSKTLPTLCHAPQMGKDAVSLSLNMPFNSIEFNIEILYCKR